MNSNFRNKDSLTMFNERWNFTHKNNITSIKKSNIVKSNTLGYNNKNVVNSLNDTRRRDLVNKLRGIK